MTDPRIATTDDETPVIPEHLSRDDPDQEILRYTGPIIDKVLTKLYAEGQFVSQLRSRSARYSVMTEDERKADILARHREVWQQFVLLDEFWSTRKWLKDWDYKTGIRDNGTLHPIPTLVYCSSDATQVRIALKWILDARGERQLIRPEPANPSIQADDVRASEDDIDYCNLARRDSPDEEDSEEGLTPEYTYIAGTPWDPWEGTDQYTPRTMPDQE